MRFYADSKVFFLAHSASVRGSQLALWVKIAVRLRMLLWLCFAVRTFFCVRFILLRLVKSPMIFNITKFALESGFWLQVKAP